MLIADIETPALVIDLEKLELNLKRAAEYVRRHGLRLRPHTKTHKIVALARRQLAFGADGLTVAKVGEAEVMLRAAPLEILVAYPVIGQGKLDRLMRVARKTRVTVALDTFEAARQLSEFAHQAGMRIGVLAEADVGFGRMGTKPQYVRPLAEEILRLPGVTFEGIAFFPGHILEIGEESRQALNRLSALIGEILADLGRAGIEARIVRL